MIKIQETIEIKYNFKLEKKSLSRTVKQLSLMKTKIQICILSVTTHIASNPPEE